MTSSPKPYLVKLANEQSTNPPKYEVMPPDGYRFKGEELHSRLAWTMKEAKEYLAMELEACPHDCSCNS